MKPNDKRPEAVRKYAKKRSESILAKRKKQYIGSIVNGWKIIDIYKKESERNYFCKALCPMCGKPAEIRLSFVKNTGKCMRCTNNIQKSSTVIHKLTDVDGSSLVSVKMRIEGKVNCNSSTGVNGVFFDRGKYRAAIFFKGKRTYLGRYSTIEEAAAARKQAEEILYKEYLNENEGWEQKLRDSLCKLEDNNEQPNDT